MTEVDSLSARAKIALKSTSFYVKYFLFIQNTKLKNPDQKGGICVLADLIRPKSVLMPDIMSWWEATKS